MTTECFPALKKIELILTYRCPRKCVYCAQEGLLKALYQSGANAKAAELQTNEICGLLSQAGELGVAWVNFGGGEPALRPDLVQLIAHATQCGIKSAMPTKNLFRREELVALKEAGLCSLGISLDSDKPEQVGELVGDPSFFEEMIANIRMAKEVDLFVMLLPVISRKTFPRLPHLLRLAESLGVDSVKPQIYSNSAHLTSLASGPRDSAIDGALRLRDEQEVLRWISELDSPLLSRKEERPEPAEKASYPTSCTMGKGILFFGPNGSAYICPLITDYVVGDIRRQSLREIWYDGAIRRLLFPNQSDFQGTACASCPSFDRCAAVGRCPQHCLEEYGTAFAPDAALCRRFKQQARDQAMGA
jgi:pyrroloquinoline quinone biosynthesis protein E